MTSSAPETSQPLESLLWQQLTLVNDWLKYAETKNTVALAFAGALMTAFATVVGSEIKHPDWLIWTMGVASVFAAFSALVCVSSLFPALIDRFTRRSPADPKYWSGNLIYFGHIAELVGQDFLHLVCSRYGYDVSIPRTYATDIANQIVANSRIAETKFYAFGLAAKFLAAAFAALLIVPVLFFVYKLLP